MDVTKEQMQNIIGTARTEKAIASALNKAGIYFENASAESGYINFRIRNSAGHIRIYKNSRKEICLQQWKQVKLEYSGIPTFFATDSYF